MTVPDKFRGLRVLFAGVANLSGVAIVRALSAFAQWHAPELIAASSSDEFSSDEASSGAEAASRIVRQDVRTTLGDSLFGASGQLRARFLLPDAAAATGRASDSRHQYGDAADVDLRGEKDWMPDLDGDGNVTVADARVIARAAERVEAKYPSLVGGIGVYPATSAHGPFVHIDVRGSRARWGAL